MLKLILTSLILVLAVQAKTWEVNPDHSYIEFEIDYMLVSKVKGRFDNFTGTFNKENLSLVIDSSSVYTGNKVRDGHLQEKHFFHSRLFPHIKFESTAVSKKSISGNLTIKDTKKLVTFKVQESVKKLDTWQYSNKFLKFDGIISLKNMGINWNKTLPGDELILGDSVKVSGVLQLQPEGAVTPGFKFKIPDTGYIRMREKVQRGEIEAPKEEAQISKLDKPYELVPIPKKIERPKSSTPAKEEEDKSTWAIYLSISFISLLSFCGLILASIQLKSSAASKYGQTRKVEILFDSICIALAFIFALSLNTLWKLL